MVQAKHLHKFVKMHEHQLRAKWNGMEARYLQSQMGYRDREDDCAEIRYNYNGFVDEDVLKSARESDEDRLIKNRYFSYIFSSRDRV
jgi:uncharacterized protein YeeX (DUF496 family)